MQSGTGIIPSHSQKIGCAARMLWPLTEDAGWDWGGRGVLGRDVLECGSTGFLPFVESKVVVGRIREVGVCVDQPAGGQGGGSFAERGGHPQSRHGGACSSTAVQRPSRSAHDRSRPGCIGLVGGLQQRGWRLSCADGSQTSVRISTTACSENSICSQKSRKQADTVT